MKRALITGGTRGIGLAICRTFLHGEWAVTTCARKPSPEIAQLERQFPDRIRFIAADLGTADGALQLAQSARVHDGIDALIANAGIGTEGLLTLTSIESIEQCVRVNLVAPMLLAREAIKGMINRGGSLVFVSSVAAQTGFKGLSVYGATKGGLISFSRSLAREYGERGIRSNCVLPGFIETEMNASVEPMEKERLARRCALKRLGQAEEVAGAVRFLVSDEARYITGTEVVVDGGMTA